MAGEQQFLSTEIVNRGIESSGPDAGFHDVLRQCPAPAAGLCAISKPQVREIGLPLHDTRVWC